MLHPELQRIGEEASKVASQQKIISLTTSHVAAQRNQRQLVNDQE